MAPLFNAEGGLRDALHQIAAIEFPCLEVVLVDDASTDGTLALAREFAATRQGWQVRAQLENGGLARARNTGLAAARGRFIWFVDWDDYWSRRIISLLHATALRTGADIVVGRAHTITPAGAMLRITEAFDAPRQFDRVATLELLLGGELQGFVWTKLFSREVLGAAPFVAGTEPREDLGALFRLLPAVNRIATIPDVVYRYVDRPGSLSKARAMRIRSIDWLGDQAVAAVERVGHPSPQLDLLALRFQYAAVLIERAKSAAANRSHPAARRVLRSTARAVRWRDCLRLLPHFPQIAAQSGLLKVAPRCYGPTQQLFIWVREQLRGSR